MALMVARFLVSAGLLAFAFTARPEAPELAGAAVTAVALHWLPPSRSGDANDRRTNGIPKAREVA